MVQEKADCDESARDGQGFQAHDFKSLIALEHAAK